MGRRQTIYVNTDQLLRGIDAERTRQMDESRQRRAAGFRVNWELKELEDSGPKIDFERFVGRSLSGSERVRHQEALRALEAAGLVSIYGLRATRCRLTDAGRAHLASLDGEAPAP